MIDENEDIHTDDEPDLSTELTVEAETTAPRKGVGRGFVMGGFLLSALLGGTLGIAGTKMLAGPDEMAALRTELEQSLAALEKSSQTQTKKLGTASSAQEKTKTRLDELQAENDTLTDQIESLEHKVKDMKKIVADNTAATEINDRIAVLEALSSEEADVFSGAGSIAARLKTLEDKIVDIQQLPPQDMPDTASELLPPGAAHMEPVEKVSATFEDENRIPATPLAVSEQQAAVNILIDTFPRQKLLAAVKAQETSAARKPGWLKRALSKHIKVNDDDPVDPYFVIDAAEAALKDGDITKALAQISKLNPPVRTSAAEWVQAAKKAARTIENH